MFDDKKVGEYWIAYNKIQSVLDHFGCEQLICAGISLSNMKSVQNFYNKSSDSITEYSLQTFQSEPYAFVNEDGELSVVRTTDGGYLRNRILTLQQNVPAFMEKDNKPYITGWSDTLLTYSVLNDSCFRGAEIIKNIIDCAGYVKAVAPKMSLDLMYPIKQHGKILIGADGLISKHGIKKPSFYSYSFMNRIGDEYLTKDNHSIVFAHRQNYQIVCHNCKRLSYRYYLEEQNLDLNHYVDYFDDLEPIRLKYQFENMKDGEYLVKIRVMSQEKGSVQDEFKKMGLVNELYIHPNDIHYLQQTSIPSLQLKKITVKNGKATFELELPANAFAHLHFVYQF